MSFVFCFVAYIFILAIYWYPWSYNLCGSLSLHTALRLHPSNGALRSLALGALPGPVCRRGALPLKGQQGGLSTRLDAKESVEVHLRTVLRRLRLLGAVTVSEAVTVDPHPKGSEGGSVLNKKRNLLQAGRSKHPLNQWAGEHGLHHALVVWVYCQCFGWDTP